MYLVSNNPSSHWGMVCCLCCVAWYEKERKTKILAFINLLDLGEVYSRLLDHRPVIQGEIRYFVKEFEVSICILMDSGAVWNIEHPVRYSMYITSFKRAWHGFFFPQNNTPVVYVCIFSKQGSNLGILKVLKGICLGFFFPAEDWQEYCCRRKM